MYHAPFPAGFPLTRESPRILAEDTLTDRAASQRLRKELAEQEPRYETGVAPYPSGTENLCASKISSPFREALLRDSVTRGQNY